MKILYDIAVLGLGHVIPRARTGIFRVVEHTALGLAQSDGCDLDFYTSHHNYLQCIEYLNSNSIFNDRQLSYIQKNFPSLQKIIKCLPASFFIYNNLEKILSKVQLNITNHELNNQAADICHSAFYKIPQAIKTRSYKTFQTIHDLIPILFPKFFEFKEDHLIKGILNSLDRETFVLCVSESTKNDLCNYSKSIDPNKVFVVPLAASGNFFKSTDPATNAAIRAKYRIPEQASYFLSVSTLEPRKNIDQTIKAFIQIFQEQKPEDLYLVLTGTKGWDYDRIFTELTNPTDFNDRIILTGYVPDEDLAPLFSEALGFVYPSFYEGFGLPPLEAMQCGTPVITSNTSSLPEVVGDAGIMVSPTDLDALCHAMIDLHKNEGLRQELSARSLARAKRFSWEKYIRDVINAYKMALGR